MSGGLEEPLFRILACVLLTASVVSYTLKVRVSQLATSSTACNTCLLLVEARS